MANQSHEEQNVLQMIVLILETYENGKAVDFTVSEFQSQIVMIVIIIPSLTE